GAQAGSLSPFAPTGLIVNGLMAKVGLGGHEWHNYATNAFAHAFVAFSGYFLFGGLKLFRYEYAEHTQEQPEAMRLEFRNWLTIVVIGALIIGVLFFSVNVGMGAFLGAVILA